MRRPIQQNAEKLQLRSGPGSSLRLRPVVPIVFAVVVVAQLLCERVLDAALVAPFGALVIFVLQPMALPLVLPLVRVAFGGPGCAVVSRVALVRATGGGYRDNRRIDVVYQGGRGRLVSVGWDEADTTMRRCGRLVVLWMLVEVEGSGREVVLLPVDEDTKVEKLIDEVRAFAFATGSERVRVSDAPWGLWTAEFYLSGLREGHLPLWGSARREADLAMTYWGAVERATFKRVRAGRRLRVGVGDLCAVAAATAVPLGMAFAFMFLAEGLNLTPQDENAPALTLVINLVFLVSTVAPVAILTALLRLASHRLRRRWLQASLSDWHLLSSETSSRRDELNEAARRAAEPAYVKRRRARRAKRLGGRPLKGGA